MTGRELDRIAYLRRAWKEEHPASDTVLVRVDEKNVLYVLCHSKRQAQELEQNKPDLVASLNTRLGNRKSDPHYRVTRIALGKVDAGTIELARLVIDLQEHLRSLS